VNFLDTVTWLHVGLSSKCNAWCPDCGRNKNGYGLADGLVEQDLSLSRLKEVLNQLPLCTTVQLCGNLGDPIAAANITEVLDYLISANYKIMIHTNGSLKTTEWWSNLGKKLANTEHKVYFAIDGLEDTHSKYRQGTNWQKIINNATAFINTGGHAIWFFLLYAFNEHQIKDCMKLSQKLKFKQFNVIKNPRVINLAFDYKTGQPYKINSWSRYDNYNEITNHNTSKGSCMHLQYPSLYLNENGKLSVCCFIPDLEYDETLDIASELKTAPRTECKKYCKFNATGNIIEK
jgi:sulfatase maturation enzyme AslB (radical SAM superfamily)